MRVWNSTRIQEALNKLWAVRRLQVQLSSVLIEKESPINDHQVLDAGHFYKKKKKKKPIYSVWNNYLLRWGHKVDGSVVIIIFLDEAEGELVVDQQIVYLEDQTGKKGLISFLIIRHYTVYNKAFQSSEEYTQCDTTREYYDSMDI